MAFERSAMPRPFPQLTRRGQLRRLRRAALEALLEYPLNVRRVRLLAIETNLFFRVDTETSDRYALRVGTARARGGDPELEVQWLHALRRDTDLHVAEPVPRSDRGIGTRVSLPEVPTLLDCTLFRWVPGRRLVECLSCRNYHELGRMAARLHEHAASFPVPADRQPTGWDRVFYRLDEPVLIFREEHRHFFSAADLSLLSEAVRRADNHLRGLAGGQQPPRLLHGDLHMWNVHVHRGVLHLLDFEDLKWGHPVQDLAVTLFYGRDRPDYPNLRQAFREGYETRLAWPFQDRDELELLMAARGVRLLNQILPSHPDPRGYAARLLRRLEWMRRAGPLPEP